MIAIVGDRASGKTEQLVKLSALTGIPIFAPSVGHASNVRMVANRLGLSIPKPVPFIERNFIGSRRVMIEEAQTILEKEFGIDVVCATFDASRVDMSSITLLELVGMWWRMRKGSEL